MNNRFWEIVEQADEQGGDDPDIRDQVFAELIIKECISACATDRLGKTVGAEELIKQHFGVEQ